jgi:CheY-like chemotaxis protein
VAHDFNNLLTAIIGYGDVALQTLPPGTELHSHVEEILVAAERAAVLTSQLLACSRKQAMQPRVLDLNTLVANITKLGRRVLGEHVELVLNLGPDLGPVRVDSGQIEQVILNLAINARDAMPQGGKLVVETGQVEIDEDYLRTHIAFKSGPYITLTISDTGGGISPDVLPHIFEPFFTTKEPGKGTGLGLSIVHGIVTQSGGYIAAYSEPGFGTTFRIYLPACVEAPARPSEERRGQALPRGTETVLLVEDDPIVLGVERSILRAAGYTVLEAENGAEAIRVLDHCGWRVDLLLTDLIMPEMNGKALADRVLARRPDISLVYCSGYAEDIIVHHGILAPGVAFLQKPFTPRALAAKLRETLDAADGARPVIQGCSE